MQISCVRSLYRSLVRLPLTRASGNSSDYRDTDSKYLKALTGFTYFLFTACMHLALRIEHTEAPGDLLSTKSAVLLALMSTEHDDFERARRTAM